MINNFVLEKKENTLVFLLKKWLIEGNFPPKP